MDQANMSVEKEVLDPVLMKGLKFLRRMQAIRHTMRLQYMNTFLLVVIYPGHSVEELAELAGVAQSVMSRHIRDIGPVNRDGFLAVDHFAGKAVDQIDIVQPARFVVSGRCVENLAGRQDGRQRKEQWTSISSASCE
jgi:hypothetical protein